MTRENLQMISELLERGFVVNGDYMEYVCGSVCAYTKCKIRILNPVYSDIMECYCYWIRYESFSEGGEVFTDHHIVEERYIPENNLMEFLRDKGFRTRAEMEQRRGRRIF